MSEQRLRQKWANHTTQHSVPAHPVNVSVRCIKTQDRFTTHCIQDTPLKPGKILCVTLTFPCQNNFWIGG